MLDKQLKVLEKLARDLDEHDRQIVKTKTAVVNGQTVTVKCYPTVKTNPKHFWLRQQLRRGAK